MYTRPEAQRAPTNAKTRAIVITSSVILSHPASPLAEATLKRGAPPISAVSRTIVKVEDRTGAYAAMTESSRQSRASFLSYLPRPPETKISTGRSAGISEGEQAVRELPDFVEPLPVGLKAGIEQSSHAPAVADKTNATLGSRTGPPVARSRRLRIPAERQVASHRRAERTIVDDDIGVTDRSIFEGRQFGHCRREFD